MPKTWKECSDCNDIPCHDKHADDSGRVENVLLRIEKRDKDDQGQEIYRLTGKEKAALAQFIM